MKLKDFFVTGKKNFAKRLIMLNDWLYNQNIGKGYRSDSFVAELFETKPDHRINPNRAE